MSVFEYLAIVAFAGVVIVLITGVISMIARGAFHERYGNRLMRLRIALQVLTVLFLGLAYLTGS